MLKFAGLSYKHPFIIDLFESRAKKKKDLYIAFGGHVSMWSFSPISTAYLISTT